MGYKLDMTPADIDKHSLRTGGATALLCAGVDQNDIQLFGYWKLDVMIRYLHITYSPVVQHFAKCMFQHGNLQNIPQNLDYDGTVPMHKV